jgi:Ca2+-transporting ATPase
MSASGEMVLDSAAREELLDQARQMADQALRVIAVAGGKGSTQADAEKDMTLLGLIGMIDPPRPEAKAAIQKCEMAGIKPVMITGDHPVTAQAVARELGLLKGGMVVTGPQLDAMSDADFERDVEKIEVYARVSPAHKLKVVTALQKKGHSVAMTGDGVNDAPALKKADIGIAMGITGTDVTKEAAAMMLTDDNFASIVAAVEEGRAIFGNIKKYLMYLLSCNIGELLVVAVSSLAGMPLPIGAVQILYVNLATDGLPALALAVDPPESDLMMRKPRNPEAGIFTRSVLTMMLIGGFWTAAAILGLYIWSDHSGRSHKEAMAMTFAALIIIQFVNAYNFRSDRHSVFVGTFSNRWLNMAILWEMLLLFAVIYVPFLQKPFGTVPLTLSDWIIVLITALSILPVLETAKWMERRGWFGRMVD